MRPTLPCGARSSPYEQACWSLSYNRHPFRGRRYRSDTAALPHISCHALLKWIFIAAMRTEEHGLRPAGCQYRVWHTCSYPDMALLLRGIPARDCGQGCSDAALVGDHVYSDSCERRYLLAVARILGRRRPYRNSSSEYPRPPTRVPLRSRCVEYISFQYLNVPHRYRRAQRGEQNALSRNTTARPCPVQNRTGFPAGFRGSSSTAPVRHPG